MTKHDATEQAYTNGFTDGYSASVGDAKMEIDRLNKQIAKLTAERDALKKKYLSAETDATNLTGELVSLLSDVKSYQGSICCYCKHIVRDNEKKQVYCGHFGDFPTSDGMPLECGRWEWRGVNHD